MKIKNLILPILSLSLLFSCSSDSSSTGDVIRDFLYEEVIEPDYSVFDGVQHDIVEDVEEKEEKIPYYGAYIGLVSPTRDVLTSSLTIDGVRFFVKYGTIMEIIKIKVSESHYDELESQLVNDFGMDLNQEGYFLIGYDDSDSISQNSPFETLVFPNQFQGKDILGVCCALNLEGLKNLSLPGNATYYNAFTYYCLGVLEAALPSTLENIRLPKYLGHLPEKMLWGTKLRYFPSAEIQSLESEACAYSGLEKIELPSSVNQLGSRVFYICKSLTYCDLSKTSITELPDSAFYQAFSLKTVYLPRTIATIGADVFDECQSLERIYYPGTMEEFRKNVKGSPESFEGANKDAKIVCYDGLINIYAYIPLQ